MVRNIVIRILLLPFSILYGLGVALRNAFYNTGLLKSVEFSLPVISVGNLTVGGAGKTPHTEYLIQLLKEDIKLATMSRGYGRKTRGFFIAEEHHSAVEIGDEPLQYLRKYDDIVVSVSESRALGIPKLLSEYPDIQTILLDDAFQHRSVKPGLNILLTEYSKPYYKDFLLPTGRLREWATASKRADIIIVSKCPLELKKETMHSMKKKLRLGDHQKLFFSYYHYDRIYNIFNPVETARLENFDTCLIVSAIAQTDYMIEYLDSMGLDVRDISFEDHHRFTNYEIARMIKVFQEIESGNKVLLTTEKDAMRLELHKGYFLEHDTKVFALPVQVRFHEFEDGKFDRAVRNHLLEFKS